MLLSVCACAAPEKNNHWLERGKQIRQERAVRDWQVNQAREMYNND
jgi:hypothetical protein